MPATTFSFITLAVLLYLLSFTSNAQPFIHFEPINAFYEAPTMTRFGNLAFDDRGHLCASVKSQGLHCYDGVHIKTLYDGDVAGIVGNNGQVLGATREKIFRLEQGVVQFLPEHRQPHLESEERITQVFADQYSDLLILTNRGIYRLYEDSVKNIYQSDDESFYFVASAETEDALWISSNQGFYQYQINSQESQITFADALVYEMTEDFYLTNHGIYQRDTHQLLFAGEFFRSLKLSDNAWLLAGLNGICHLQNLQALNCHSTFANHFKQDITAHALLADQHGNIFASTSNGLYVSQPKFYQNFTQNHGLLSDRVMSLLQVEHFLYVGTHKGLNRVNRQTNEISTIAGTENMAITSIERVDDTLWLGVKGQGVYVLTLSNHQLTKLIDAEHYLFSITWNDDVVYLAIQDQGLFKYDTTGNLLISRTQKHFKEIREIALCDTYLLVGTITDGLIKLNSELLIEDYTNAINAHTFVCQEDKVIAGSRSGELQILNAHLKTQQVIFRDNPIYTLLPYRDSFVALHEKGLYFGENQHITLMPMPAFINVWSLDGDTLYFGSVNGLFRVNLLEAEVYEPPVAMMTFSMSDTETGKWLHLRSENILDSLHREWFLSYDNQNFSRLLHPDVLIPSHESKKSLFVYSTDQFGQNSPVKEIAFSKNTRFSFLDSPFLYFFTGMMFLTIVFYIYHYKNSLILFYRSRLLLMKSFSFSIKNEDSYK
ncbi:MAG: hypothetical protein AAGB12_14460 [Pseudomonadota bacterium]